MLSCQTRPHQKVAMPSEVPVSACNIPIRTKGCLCGGLNSVEIGSEAAYLVHCPAVDLDVHLESVAKLVMLSSSE